MQIIHLIIDNLLIDRCRSTCAFLDQYIYIYFLITLIDSQTKTCPRHIRGPLNKQKLRLQLNMLSLFLPYDCKENLKISNYIFLNHALFTSMFASVLSSSWHECVFLVCTMCTKQGEKCWSVVLLVRRNSTSL